MARIKAVAFDYGRVISLSPVPGTAEKLAALADLPVETLRKLDLKYRGDLLDRGTCDSQEYYRRIFSYAGVTRGEEKIAEIARTDFDTWKNINDETVHLMRDVKRLGYKTAVLSNMPRDFLTWAWESVPVFHEVDAAIFSCDLNMIKPEEAIYRVLIDALGCEYREVVFFDDLEDNIAKAKELGIYGFVFTDPAAAREELRALGFAAL
jgi:HAD superfamily hydrolase (TIGR01509 family)